MATRILDLPMVGCTILVGTNEDWLDGLGAYLDAGGAPIPLDGLVLDFQMRPQASDGFIAPLNASTASTVLGMPLAGTLSASGNAVAITVPRAAMLRVAPGTYDAELQAVGDGLRRTIGRYTVTVVEGVLR